MEQQTEEQSEFIIVTVPAEELRPISKSKRRTKSPAPKGPVAREGFSLPPSAPPVPSRSARLVSAERAKSQPFQQRPRHTIASRGPEVHRRCCDNLPDRALSSPWRRSLWLRRSPGAKIAVLITVKAPVLCRKITFPSQDLASPVGIPSTFSPILFRRHETAHTA